MLRNCDVLDLLSKSGWSKWLSKKVQV